MGKKHSRAASQWRNFDFHIHTPASSDFQQPEVTYIETLQRAEARGLDIIAFTDHNTVSGYRKLQEDIKQLELLETLNRLMPDERQRLNEYRRLQSKILVLPGFEFTATFGFHILGIFPPDKSVRELEHLLLSMNIPAPQLDEGSATVGATTDVITAYRMINQAGGLVIAAHANSSNGVAMKGFSFGGQTKIAYTQDPNLHALEVTDLEVKGPRATATFFNGTKPEYPRRMHCVQGSDSHRLVPDLTRKKVLGLGDRSTDVLLSEISFEDIKELFLSNDFSRTRPHRYKEEPAFDFIQSALDEGPNIIQDFHESVTVRGGKMYAIIADVCAFANTNGGTLYLGLSTEAKNAPPGITGPEQSITQLDKEINTRITPPLQSTLDAHEFHGKKIIRVLIPRGIDPPYAVDDNKIYVRNEAETSLAVRDEIVNLVLRSSKFQTATPNLPEKSETISPAEHEISAPDTNHHEDYAPHTGVEVIPAEDREGSKAYSMRDLRNGNVVKNVTRASARRLWHYAIGQHLEITAKPEWVNIQWQGDFGLIKSYSQGKTKLYDLIQKSGAGFRYYFGVTQDGIHGPWKSLAGEEDL